MRHQAHLWSKAHIVGILLSTVVGVDAAHAHDDPRVGELLQEEVQALGQRQATRSDVAAHAARARRQQATVDMVAGRLRHRTATPSAAGPEEVVRSGKSGVRLTVSGQVNRALLAWDDGVSADVYNVDNDNSGTRFRLLGEADVSDEFKITGAIELQAQVNKSDAVSQTDANTGLSTDLRRAEVIATSKRYGKVWLGKGWTASDYTSEDDLSGTHVVGYARVWDMAGGLFFRNRATDAFGPTINASFTDLDGLGRQVRIRYDAPPLSGFVGAASVTSGGAWDAALRYGGNFGDVKTAAAVAYASGTRIGLRGNQVNGSASFLHSSGINLTLAAGRGENKDDNGVKRNNTTFWYVKGGYIADIFGFGTTNFAIDGGQSYDVSTNGNTGSTIGFQIVQNLLKYGTQIYAAYRWYSLSSREDSFFGINAGMAGARIKF